MGHSCYGEGMSNTCVKPRQNLRGTIRVPGDKSISHRSLIFGALAEGETHIKDLLDSADVKSTKACLESLGACFTGEYDDLRIVGLNSQLRPPTGPLDCGNSGTTIRLLMGVLAGCKFSSHLIGDESLSKRPMARVAIPLNKMGAQFQMSNDNYPPLSVVGQDLNGIEYDLPHASAQVKSAILLASLFAKGTTRLTGKIQSRDHTERLFRQFGLTIEETGTEIVFDCGQALQGSQVTVPGDPSTASFWVAAAGLVPNSKVVLENVSLNPTRTGFFEVAKRMGIQLNVEVLEDRGEPLGRLTAEYGELKPVTVTAEEVPFLIDEIPILAILAAKAHGTSTIRGAGELRVKESDRIEAVAQNLRAMGVELTTFEDGMEITGPQTFKGSSIETFHDHRIAMAFSIAGLVADSETVINDADVISVSYPGFFSDLARLTQES